MLLVSRCEMREISSRLTRLDHLSLIMLCRAATPVYLLLSNACLTLSDVHGVGDSRADAHVCDLQWWEAAAELWMSGVSQCFLQASVCPPQVRPYWKS